MKVVVTGGTGFLGQRLAIKLNELGHEVVTLSRRINPNLEKTSIRQYQIDLTQEDPDLDEILTKTDVVFHTAAKVAMWGKWEDFYQVNFLGTKNLLQKAKKAQVKAFIYTSTPSVVFEDQDLKGVDESTPYAKDSKSRYARSKILAEEFVIRNNSSDFKTTALRPHLIFGPGDENIIPRLIAKAKKGRLKIIGSGQNKVDIIHIDNAVHAHVAALQNILKGHENVSGQVFFLGQERPVVLWEFINQLLEIYHVPKVEKKIPFRLVYGLGAVFEFVFSVLKITKKEPPMTRFVAMQLAKSHYFSHENSSKNLGYTPVLTIEESLATLQD